MSFLILIFLAMAGAAFYVRKRTSPRMFAALAVVLGLGIYILGILFMPRQQNLWVNSGSGNAPRAWYKAISAP